MVCCGEKFCMSCLANWFAVNPSCTCLYCRIKLEPSAYKWCVPEKGMKREIESFQVFCCYKKNGCGWIGELRHLSDHSSMSSKGCVYRKVKCPNKCKTSNNEMTLVLLKDMKEHLKIYCQMIRVTCTQCNHEGLRKDSIRHTKLCQKFPISCPNDGCLETTARENVADHLKSCQFGIVSCMNREVGCEAELKRQDLESHVSSKCEFRSVKCQHCKQVSKHKDQASHYDVCELYPQMCPNDCGETGVTRKSLQLHRTQCPLESVKCSLGCKSMMRRKELAEHETSQCVLRRVNCPH